MATNIKDGNMIEVNNTRNLRYGEILVVKEDGAEVFNTTGLNEAPSELWDSMHTKRLAHEFDAMRVQKNGPKYWMMDSQSLILGGTASFDGIKARWAASLPVKLLGKEGAVPYRIFTSKRTQRMVYEKDKLAYELVDPDGHVYVMQAHGPSFTIESLSKLGEKMQKLPEGWKYRTRILTEDLVLNLTPDTIHMVGDEFHQYYTRISETE